MTRHAAVTALLSAGLIAGLALMSAGGWAIGSDRCFFHQFPPPSCTSHAMPGLGVLFFTGMALVAVVAAAGSMRKP